MNVEEKKNIQIVYKTFHISALNVCESKKKRKWISIARIKFQGFFFCVDEHTNFNYSKQDLNCVFILNWWVFHAIHKLKSVALINAKLNEAKTLKIIQIKDKTLRMNMFLFSCICICICIWETVCDFVITSAVARRIIIIIIIILFWPTLYKR